MQDLLRDPRPPGRAGAPVGGPPEAGRIGKYPLIEQLGECSWKAQDPTRDGSLVLHILGEPAGPEAVNALCAEVRPLAALKHPVLLPWRKLSQHNGRYFIVRTYVSGKSAGAEVLVPLRAAQAVYQMTRAIEFAHAQGLVHGSLTPSNVILDANGQPFIVDFGVTRLRALAKSSGQGPRPSDPVDDLAALGALYWMLLSGTSGETAPPLSQMPGLRSVHPVADAGLERIGRKFTSVRGGGYILARDFAEELGALLTEVPSDYTSSVGLHQRYLRAARESPEPE